MEKPVQPGPSETAIDKEESAGFLNFRDRTTKRVPHDKKNKRRNLRLGFKWGGIYGGRGATRRRTNKDEGWNGKRNLEVRGRAPGSLSASGPAKKRGTQ